MESSIDLKQMPLPDKLRLMEALWNDLCSREEEIPVPEWHKELLDERDRQIQQGEAAFADLATAKKNIANRIS